MDTVSNVVTWDLALSFPKAIFLPPKFLKTAGDRIKTAGEKYEKNICINRNRNVDNRLWK